MNQSISPNVISLGRAVLGFDPMTIRSKFAMLESATLPELIATKILLEQYHSNTPAAIRTIALQIRMRQNSIAA